MRCSYNYAWVSLHAFQLMSEHFLKKVIALEELDEELRSPDIHVILFTPTS